MNIFYYVIIFIANIAIVVIYQVKDRWLHLRCDKYNISSLILLILILTLIYCQSINFYLEPQLDEMSAGGSPHNILIIYCDIGFIHQRALLSPVKLLSCNI